MDPVLSHFLRTVRPGSIKEEFLRISPDAYAASHDITLLVATYNVNGRCPPPDMLLSQWLNLDLMPHIVAVGFQELVPLSASNVVMGASLEAAAAWDRVIRETLNSGEAGISRPAERCYVQVAAKQMVGLYLTIWVAQTILPQIRGVQVAAVGTGVMGYLGNKGAVAARMRVYDTSLELINAHMSSGESETDNMKRHSDYLEIIRRGLYPPDSNAVDPNTSWLDASCECDHTIIDGPRGSGQWGEARSFLKCDQTFWMGDLNYRLDMPDEQVRKHLHVREFDALAERDELVQARNAGAAFQGWVEGPLTFPPTYKFKRGTSHYVGTTSDDARMAEELAKRSDAHSSSLEVVTAAAMLSKRTSMSAVEESENMRRRTPAWTDRVLWRPDGRPGAPRQLTYTSAMDILLSDHRPVQAAFIFPVRQYVRELAAAAVEAARRKVDAREMAAIPRCELSPLNLDLGDVRFAEQKKFQLLLRNTGQVAARFHWTSGGGTATEEAPGSLPDWASINPMEGEVEKGAATEMDVFVHIVGGPEGHAEKLLSSEGCVLNAILVLSIHGGNDIFCSLVGTFIPSFFGLSLSTLANLSRPLAQAQQQSQGRRQLLHNIAVKPLAHDAEASAAPREEEDHFWSPMSSTAELHSGDDPIFFNVKDNLSALRPTAEVKGDANTQGERQSGSVMSPFSREPASAESDSVVEHNSMSESRKLDALVPPEVRALLERLHQVEARHLLNAFVQSAEHSLCVLRETAAATPPSWSLPTQAVHRIRSSLDCGDGVPDDAGVMHVTTTLLAFFSALPQPFMPSEVNQVCDVCIPSLPAASSLLADSMSPPEWAVFRNVTGLLRNAFTQAEAPRQAPCAMAALLAEIWFESSPAKLSAGGKGLRPEAVTDLQRLAEDFELCMLRRAAFLELFLDL